MVIFTGGRRTVDNDIVNLDDYSNEKRFDKKVSNKRKRLDMFNEKVNMPKNPNIEKSRMVEENSEIKRTP